MITNSVSLIKRTFKNSKLALKSSHIKVYIHLSNYKFHHLYSYAYIKSRNNFHFPGLYARVKILSCMQELTFCEGICKRRKLTNVDTFET